MAGFEGYKPVMAMILTQFIYAGVTLFTRAALLQGMSPRVFVVFRQAFATLVISPIAFFSTRKRTSSRSVLNLRSFCWMFLASLIGITGTQNAYFEGLDMASSSIAIAAMNLIPATTFLMAFIFGSIRSVAKVGGTVICVSAAICMAIFKGPKLWSSQMSQHSVSGSGDENLLVGFLFVFGSCCCWSIWLILQVPLSECYPDHLSSTAWMCFFATLQCAILTLVLEWDRPEAWILHPYIEIVSCCYSGVLGSGLGFFLQSWCISQKGPLFTSLFHPLSTIIVTIFAFIFLHEAIYTGSLIGAITVIIGLYVVLWGKAGDLGTTRKATSTEKQKQNDDMTMKIDLNEPLLSDHSDIDNRIIANTINSLV